MGFLQKLFGGGSAPLSDPITLIFECGHQLENGKPPKMSADDRERALMQARQVRCSKCAPDVWARYETQGAHPELRKATQRT